MDNGEAAPDTDTATINGNPNQEGLKLFYFDQNIGSTDGVAQYGAPDPTATLVALAVGRNPTDITIPTLAGSEASGGEGGDAIIASGSGSATGDNAGASPGSGSSVSTSSASSGNNSQGLGDAEPMDDGGGAQGSNLVTTFDPRPLNDEEKDFLISQGYGDVVQLAECNPGGPVPAQLVFDAVQRRGMFGRAQPEAEVPVRIAVRTPDEVVLEVAGKIEAATRPYVVRAGAALGVAGDLGAGYVAVATLVAPEVTVPGAIGAGIMLGLSADSAQANARTLVSGRPQATGLHQAVAAGATALGADPGEAERLGQVADLTRQSAQAWKMAMVFPTGGAPQDAASNSSFYSVAFETKLSAGSYPGFSRRRHFQEANENLLQAMEADAAFAQTMQQGGVNLARTATGLAPRTPPTNWTWNHAEEPGVMQLVPTSQHTAGSIFYDTMHPGGRGGYAIWGKE